MSLSLEPRGLTIRWTDRSFASQCGAFVPASLFLEYEVPSAVELGAVFGPLFEAVALCAAGGEHRGSGGGLPADLVELSYPGPDAELVFASAAGAFGEAVSPARSSLRSCALLTTCDLPQSTDLAEAWGRLAASFTVTPSALLKEAAEDLEWTSGPGRVTVSPVPGAAGELGRRVAASLESEDTTGSAVRVELPQSALGGGTCAAPRVSHRYARRALRAACGSVPGGGGGSSAGDPAAAAARAGLATAPGSTQPAAAPSSSLSLQGSSKVSIDEEGMLRVTHALPQLPRLGRARGGGPGGAGISVPSQLESRGGGFEDVVVVQHVLLPLVDDVGDE